ncbi:ABC transporter substrate-binding protein [Phytoactinopolyspora mesophila]|uniref:ABC transporter substrate-binding protein n=1 Tax=Phytoactinopolyspora mesophila TaxID=2650750 RepID=A0A7K3MAJ2_9ACTN|nr:ABC transporter substrate-binding protein [Phytoactinopolyspora mesophila]NDL59992.1 ABC transporter substrate-binding protein [Phytoactinopolyspora mesophila]
MPVALVVLAACGEPAEDGAEAQDHHIVLADSYEPENFNPVAGHGEDGSSKIYDGLLRLAAGEQATPELEPALATGRPEVNADATEWTLELRDDVTFHDGSEFSADDVVATFEAIIDPAFASPLASAYGMLDRVEKVDNHTVRFHLEYSYAPFDTRLLLGIVPAAAVADPAPVEESPLNTEPIGTGPYRLDEWRRGERVVLEANDEYWDGAPDVTRLTIASATDDNTRAQRMRSGEFDGAWLPPKLAATFADADDAEVVTNPSADWRGITMPAGHPVTGDPDIRMALNLAVDREAMIETVLAGHGVPAHTLIPEVFGQYYNPAAVFQHDPEAASQLLDDTGWDEADDGIRVKDGQRAEFTVMYFPEETVRRDLGQAFASDARAIGIEVTLEAVDRPEFRPRTPQDAGVLGGGDFPFDPDPQVYNALHSQFADYDDANPFLNPTAFRDDDVDAALDLGRRSLDEEERVQAYHEIQQRLVDDPPYVMLAFLDHTYVMKADDRWTGTTQIVEPHAHGVEWGPWWNIREWRRSE